MKNASIVCCLLAAALFGASTPASKMLLDSIGPLTLAGLLYLGAAAGVLPWALMGRRKITGLNRRTVLLLAGATLFGGILGPILLLIGLSKASAASTALWLNLETVATALLARFFFKEHLDAKGWFAVVLVIAAGVILASPSGFKAGQAAILIALGCLCWGVDNNLTALIDGVTPAQSTLFKGIVAGSTSLTLGFLLEGDMPGLGVGLGGLSVGAIGYGLSIVLYITGAQMLGATRSQMVFASSPFWGVIAAWVFLKEGVAPIQIVAGILMGVSLWLMHSERHAHKHSHRPMAHTHAHRHDDRHHSHFHRSLPAWMWHSHHHEHSEVNHSHGHNPDLHHRHDH